MKLEVRTRFYLAISVGLVLFFALFFLLSPFFYVETIEIAGDSRVSREEILERLDVGNNTHLLLFNTRQARSRLMENMYIGNVEFERVLPGRMQVNITERRLTAFFEHSPGSFLYLDDYGRVLEIKTFFTDPLPVLQGLSFTRFQLGEILEVSDVTAFNAIVQYAQLLNHHDLIEHVSYINVSDTSNIRIIIKSIEFNVGTAANAGEKILTIQEIITKMPNVGLIPGFVDLREIRREYFFVMLP